MTPIPARSITTAAVTSAAVGFGSGHALIGAPARTYLVEQSTGVLMCVAGLAFAKSGRDFPGPILFIGGMGVLIGSRVTELIDVIGRSADHNRQLTEAKRR